MKKTTWQAASDGRRLIIPPPKWRVVPAGMEYTFSIWLERSHGAPLQLHTITFAASVAFPAPEDLGTIALMTVLLPAMRMALPLRVEAPVSRRFLAQAEELQEIFSTWFDELTKVEIDAPVSTVRPPLRATDARGVGSHFSLGVDGWHTLRRHEAEITDLIFIHGFDIDLDKHGHRAAVQDALEEAAAGLGKRLITVHTNARCFSDTCLWWGNYGGSLLAAAGQLLAGSLRRTYVAASTAMNHFIALGTTLLTDPLFTTERMEIIHDGSAERVDKVFALAQDEFALQRLRVCWNMDGTAQNCGRCSKCIRTMTTLYLAGALDRAPTFPREIDLELIRAFRLHPTQGGFIQEHRKRAQALGMENSPVMQAWNECALRSGLDAPDDPHALLNERLVKSFTKEERDQIFADLLAHAPEALAVAAAKHAPRARSAAFDHLWKHHRGALWKAIWKGSA